MGLVACGEGELPSLSDADAGPSGRMGTDAGPPAAPTGDAGSQEPLPDGMGGITGRVFDAVTGAPLAGATVRGPGGSPSTTTDAQGRFGVMALLPGEERVLYVGREGYASGYKPLPVADGMMREAEFLLVPVAAQATIDSAQGGSVQSAGDGARADFPANALVDADGNAVTGMVELAIAPLDSSEPSQLRAFPGDFQATRMDGSQAMLETFSPMSITALSGDQALTIAPGKEAVIYFPVQADNAPQTIGLWSLNPETGHWEEEGTAQLIVNDQGQRLYRAVITHLSWWNPDRPFERSCVRACVVDADGEPAPNTAVTLTGVDYGFERQAWTDDAGCADLLSRRDRQARVLVRRGDVGAETVVTPAGDENACDANTATLALASIDDDPNCPAGMRTCGGRCIDVTRDARHCGGCDQACSAAGAACIDAGCACPESRTLCDGACADLDSSDQHCGACGNACNSGLTCEAGACVPLECSGGTIRCGDQCVDPQLDRNHCGGCGVGVSPQVGGERDGDCAAAGGTSCQEGDLSVCRFLQSDRDNCGSCGIACATGQECSAGACQAIECETGSVLCGNSCVNGDSCGEQCSDGFSCQAGSCEAIECDALALCGNACVDLQTSTQHCGECDAPCGEGQTCQAGACACDSGIACGERCVDEQTDSAHCGACDVVCSIGQQCVAGTCEAISCAEGTELCGSECIDPLSDPNHCGGCTTGIWGDGSAPAYCERQPCECPQDRTACTVDGLTACVDTQTSRDHCGGCDLACASDQDCVSGSCAARTCPEGTTACNGGCVYGSSCGERCDEGFSCATGSCACTAGTDPAVCAEQGDASSYGVCVDRDSDPYHCGACGNACATGEECNAGVCELAPCTGTEVRCNGLCVDTQTDSQHCGGCSPGASAGFGCSPISTCECGNYTVCTIDTDVGTCADLDNDRYHCGACNSPCGTGQECVSGNCQAIDCGSLTLCGNDCVESAQCGVSCDGTTQSCVDGSCVTRTGDTTADGG